MEQALELARQALEAEEIPVGAVVVRDGVLLGQGRNCREQRKSPLGHAEIQALEQASSAVGDWRLNGATLYVTLEPCPMCAGAVVLYGIPRVVIGENTSWRSSEEFLREHEVQVVVLDLDDPDRLVVAGEILFLQTSTPAK